MCFSRFVDMLSEAKEATRKEFRIKRVLLATAAIIVLTAAFGWYQGYLQWFGIYRPSNSIMVLKPYRHDGTWVFDDPGLGLRQEPFVAGTPELIDSLVSHIPDADKGFRLLFSKQEFPCYSAKLVWRRGDKTGNWYYCAQYQKEGWLCPGLFKYYQDAPKEIHVRATPPVYG